MPTSPTPADRPADQLRAAAEKLRAAAMGSPMNNSPWRYAKGLPSDSGRTEVGWEVVYGDAPGDLRYIALMHPGVGLAVAELLAVVERTVDDEGAAFVDHALAVARQLLGTTPVTAADLGPADGQQKTRALARLHTSLTPIPEETLPPAPADRAAVLREGAASVESSDVTYDTEAASAALTNGGPFALVAYVQLAIGAHLRRLADDAAAGVQPPTTSEAAVAAQQAAVVSAIRDFQFDNYGLDVDPTSEYAEWVGDLASSIVGALPAAPAAPEEPTTTT